MRTYARAKIALWLHLLAVSSGVRLCSFRVPFRQFGRPATQSLSLVGTYWSVHPARDDDHGTYGNRSPCAGAVVPTTASRDVRTVAEATPTNLRALRRADIGNIWLPPQASFDAAAILNRTYRRCQHWSTSRPLLVWSGRPVSRLSDTTRADGRADAELRPTKLPRAWQPHPAGSVPVEFGRTKVLCAASASIGVPRWRKDSGLGWVTAEYAMLPSATNTRSDRESVKGRIGGRTHEISRLIGRSLRAAIDYKALGENTIVIDCDVLQADGGTRTAAITGAYVALADAVSWLRTRGALVGEPLVTSVAAVSVGVIEGAPRLDLCYEEDVTAETDMNVVCTGDGRFVEVQGTAEGVPFDRSELDALLDLAVRGCTDLARLQQEALAR